MAEIEHEHEQQETQETQEGAGAVPFFARFLEDQKRIRTGVKAGVIGVGATSKLADDGYVTQKYPSDGDDDLPLL